MNSSPYAQKLVKKLPEHLFLGKPHFFFLPTARNLILLKNLTPEKLPNTHTHSVLCVKIALHEITFFLLSKFPTKISEKAPWRGKMKIFFFLNFYFTFLFPLYSDRKNENYLLFPPFLIPQIGKPHGKTSMKIFFFFYFFLPTAPRNRKKLPLTFFSEIPKFRRFCEKAPWKSVSKIPLSALKYPFFRNSEKKCFWTNYVFSAVITRTHTHTLFYGPIMRKNRANTFFLKLLFFCSLILLLTPEKLPNYLFRPNFRQKLVKKLSLKGKNNFFFPIFPLLWIFTFSTLFNTTNSKTAKNVFFFFFISPLFPLNTFFSDRKNENYLLFSTLFNTTNR